MSFKILEAQPTPNPNAMKYILDRPVSEQPTSFFTAEAASSHPLASQLFAIPGVTNVLLLGDFVTINKQPEVKWAALTSRVRAVLKAAAAG